MLSELDWHGSRYARLKQVQEDLVEHKMDETPRVLHIVHASHCLHYNDADTAGAGNINITDANDRNIAHAGDHHQHDNDARTTMFSFRERILTRNVVCRLGSTRWEEWNSEESFVF
ncbi:hypothetical protein WHR41_09280 [Cladosporium halotolerans]|uniref:Uncharacterized protein n=1 Tax=Cladosporium halotolerans TaxID=1052096 RepID=A0AB34KFL0_9PEZI